LLQEFSSENGAKNSCFKKVAPRISSQKGAKKNSSSKNLVAKMARKIVASKKSRQEFRRKKNNFGGKNLLSCPPCA
jgi:hypothetical protein